MSVQFRLHERPLPSHIGSSASLVLSHRLSPRYPYSSGPSDANLSLRLPPLRIGPVESLPIPQFPWILESNSDGIEAPLLYVHARDMRAGSNQRSGVRHAQNFRPK